VRIADVEAVAARLEALGAAVMARVTGHDHFHVAMRDPEGNELDLR
jgi:predicted enzyme related to lactoylglutathione lyase